MEKKSKKPVLLIAWKRPKHLKKVIESLRLYRPSKIYFACDGPRDELEEKIKVEKTRAIVDNEIDWPCKINKLIRDRNKGCKLAVSEAISWFFSENDDGIILEDDCVPNPFFYNYCEEMNIHKFNLHQSREPSRRRKYLSKIILQKFLKLQFRHGDLHLRSLH